MSTAINTSALYELAAEMSAAAGKLPADLEKLGPELNSLISARATSTYMSGGATLNVRSGALRTAILASTARVRRKDDKIRVTKTIGNLHGDGYAAGYKLTGVYARVHEFGSTQTGHGTPRFTTPARPFLAPALHDVIPQIAEKAGDILEGRLTAAIDEVAR